MEIKNKKIKKSCFSVSIMPSHLMGLIILFSGCVELLPGKGTVLLFLPLRATRKSVKLIKQRYTFCVRII